MFKCVVSQAPGVLCCAVFMLPWPCSLTLCSSFELFVQTGKAMRRAHELC